MDTSVIGWGQSIDPSRYTAGQRTWQDMATGDSGGQWTTGPGTWNLEGLNFGNAPEQGATAVVDNGVFSGWKGLDGNYWIPTSKVGAAQSQGPMQFGPDVNGWSKNLSGQVQGYNQNEVPAWMKYGTLGALGAMGAYGAAVAAPALIGGSGSSLAPLAGAAPGEAAGAFTGSALAPEAIAGGAGAGGGATSLLGDVVPAGAQPGFGLTPGLEQIATGAAPGGTVSKSMFETLLNRLKNGENIWDITQKFTGGPANTSQGKVGGTGNSILDLLAGVYGARQTKDMSGNLKDMYSAALGRQKPFIDQLLASYQDPNSYYNSNEYKGLASVYQNQVDRQAAAKGRMANPTDREVLLQKHALQNLDEYRKTLTGNINALDPSRYADPYAKGVMAEAYANTPLFTAAGAMGGAGGGGVGNVINTLAQAGSTAEDIWKLVSGWFA